MQKQLLLGVEAIAQGAIDSGISGVYAYPGTPSTEITEYIQTRNKLFKGISTENGLPMKRQPWKQHWACPTQGKGPWSA